MFSNPEPCTSPAVACMPADACMLVHMHISLSLSLSLSLCLCLCLSVCLSVCLSHMHTRVMRTNETLELTAPGHARD